MLSDWQIRQATREFVDFLPSDLSSVLRLKRSRRSSYT